MVNHLASTWITAKGMVRRQQSRIDAVLASGLDYEVMKGGNGKTWEIPLSKLYEYLEEAKKVDVDKLYNDWQNYKANHYPVKGLKGDLRAAKIEAELKKLKNPKFYDRKYDYLHTLMNRYQLTENQTNKLMDYFVKIGILG